MEDKNSFEKFKKDFEDNVDFISFKEADKLFLITEYTQQSKNSFEYEGELVYHLYQLSINFLKFLCLEYEKLIYMKKDTLIKSIDVDLVQSKKNHLTKGYYKSNSLLRKVAILHLRENNNLDTICNFLKENLEEMKNLKEGIINFNQESVTEINTKIEELENNKTDKSSRDLESSMYF